MPKRILMYIQTPHPGGALNSSLLLTEGLRKRGYEVLLVANRRGSVELDEEIITLGGNDITRPFKLKSLIEKYRPAVVISNIFTQNVTSGLASLLLSRELRKGIKFIAVERTTDMTLLRGQTYKLPYRFFIKKIYESLDYLVAISQAGKEDLKRAFWIRDNKIVVINNPLDFQKIKDKKREKLEEAEERIFKNFRVIINTSRFSVQKRLDLLIYAFSEVTKTFKDVKLLLIGDGEEREKLIDLVKKLNLSDKVIFRGFTENPFKYISRSFLFVHTPKDEAFGRVIAESLACGVPVVSYYNRYTGVNDIIEDGKNGFLVPFGKKRELVRRIERLLVDKDLYCSMKRRSVFSVRRFHIDKIMEKWVSLIES